jgi:hypothetical protein
MTRTHARGEARRGAPHEAAGEELAHHHREVFEVVRGGQRAAEVARRGRARLVEFDIAERRGGGVRAWPIE